MTSNIISNIPLPAISEDSSFFRYMQEIHKFPFLSPEEEYEYGLRVQQYGDREAAKILIQSHLRLVVKIATTFRNYGLPLSDLVSEGNMGLMRAVKKFDVNKGFRLSTYAMLWIKAYIQEYILRSWSLVKIGTTVAQKKIFFNLRKIKNKIRTITGDSELSPNHFKQIASDLNVKESKVLEMNQRLNKDASLNKMLGDEDNGIEMQDTLESVDPSQEKLAIINQESSRKRNAIEAAIGFLSEREQGIVRARYFVEKTMSLDKLSKIYKVSKERVRQIEEAALNKMKKSISNGIYLE